MNALAMLVLALQSAGALEVSESGDAPDRKITLTSPGVYRAVLWQSSGGGIMEFYDLVADPQAKLNLAGWDRGLFEVGWHGQNFKGPDSADCCRKHLLDGKKDATCYDGCRDWPSIGHKELKVQGSLEVIEQSAARVRVRAESYFTWWSKYADREMPLTAIYTFYPTGRIAVQMRIRRRRQAVSLEQGPRPPPVYRRAGRSRSSIPASRSAPPRAAGGFGDRRKRAGLA